MGNREPEAPQHHGQCDGVRDHDASLEICRRIGELRAERGWSLEQLSAASGVSRSMLSQIERGKANPTLAVTLRISRAFGLSLGELAETAEPTSRIDVIRADDTRFHYKADDACTIRTLSPLHLEKDVEFYEVRVFAGKTLDSAPHFEGTREFLTVESGRATLRSADAAVELGPGDSACYRADVPHVIANPGEDDVLLFLVVIYR